MVKTYIVYETILWPYTWATDFTLRNSLFGALKLTKNADPSIQSYSVYGTEFEARESFLLSGNSGFGKNVIILGADMGSSVHIHNKKKDSLILSKSPTNGLDDTTLTAEKEYSINFMEQHK